MPSKPKAPPRATALLACVLTCLGLALLGLPEAAQADPPGPLLDGRCDEYRNLAAEEHPLRPGLTLYLHQDRDHVWLCYPVPAGSFATLDLQLQSPFQQAALNLHVSAQLGDWPAGRAGPASPEAAGWWNAIGWSALPLRLRGFDTTQSPPRPRFESSPGRELQLSKQRFGRGPWSLRLHIQGLLDAQGHWGELRFPAAAEPPLSFDAH